MLRLQGSWEGLNARHWTTEDPSVQVVWVYRKHKQVLGDDHNTSDWTTEGPSVQDGMG